MPFKIRPLSAGLGAEIIGVNLAEPLDDATFAEIEQAWRDHLLLLFRDQPLDHIQHMQFSRRFGALDDHASVARLRDQNVHEILPVVNNEEDGQKLRLGAQWHSDLSHALVPARGSLLRCEQLPPVGGDTMFCNMYMAYDTLSDTMKGMLDGLYAIHDLRIALHNRGKDLQAVKERTPPVAHPLVRIHPETGRKALFISEMATSGIVGMRPEESQPLLDFLFRHSVKPEFTYRHQWRVRDLLAWDNRCTNHLALGDYPLNVPRRMYRTTLLGTPTGGFQLEDDADVRNAALRVA